MEFSSPPALRRPDPRIGSVDAEQPLADPQISALGDAQKQMSHSGRRLPGLEPGIQAAAIGDYPEDFGVGCAGRARA